MTLEDFEKSLATGKDVERDSGSSKSHRRSEEDSRHPRHHRSHHRDSEDGHKHKRRRRSKDGTEDRSNRHHHRHKRDHHDSHRQSGLREGEEEESVEKEKRSVQPLDDDPHSRTTAPIDLKRDSWMEAPSALDIDYTQRGHRKEPESTTSKSSKADFELKIHENELNKHHLQGLRDGKPGSEDTLTQPAQHEVDYLFGDAGSQWRMTKLKAVYTKAEETGQTVEEVALDKYGDLRAFDDAREEELELDRRETYGEGYVGKEKPSGELFQERKMAAGKRRADEKLLEPDEEDIPPAEIRSIQIDEPTTRTAQVDQTTLNRLKAQMMKAKIRGSADAAKLEEEYNNALAGLTEQKQSDVVVLGAMESRMLAGGRKGEVKIIDNKRGRERGHVEENDEMSIQDMVREERRTRNQAGGENMRFAERIAKDGKFDVSILSLPCSNPTSQLTPSPDRPRLPRRKRQQAGPARPKIRAQSQKHRHLGIPKTQPHPRQLSAMPPRRHGQTPSRPHRLPRHTRLPDPPARARNRPGRRRHSADPAPHQPPRVRRRRMGRDQGKAPFPSILPSHLISRPPLN